MESEFLVDTALDAVPIAIIGRERNGTYHEAKNGGEDCLGHPTCSGRQRNHLICQGCGIHPLLR